MRRIFLASFILMFLVLAFRLVQGQNTNSCAAIIRQRIENLEQVCANGERNTACYGSEQVTAEFTDESSLRAPADTAELTYMTRLSTTLINLEDEWFGVGVLRVIGDLHYVLAEKPLDFVVLGGAQVVNGVAPEAVVLPQTTLTVTTTSNARLRNRAGFEGSTITILPAGAALEADVISADGEWLRVAVDEIVGWMNQEVLDIPADAHLPVVGLTPMQHFYLLEAEDDELECALDPLLLIQNSHPLGTRLMVNEDEILMQSNIVLRIVDGEWLEISVLDGWAQTDNLLVEEGYNARAPLLFDDERELLVVDGPWRGCSPLTADDLARMRPLEEIAADEVLSEPLVMPDLRTASCQQRGETNPSAATSIPDGATAAPPAGDGSVPVVNTAPPTFTLPPTFTPSMTMTPSITPTPTRTLIPTATPALTNTPLPTFTASPIPTLTAGPSVTPFLPTFTPTSTNTFLPSATSTFIPTGTPLPPPTPSSTPIPVTFTVVPPSATPTP